MAGRRKPAVFWIGTAVLLAVAAFLAIRLVTGADESDGDALLRVELVDDAIAAVIDERGADTEFYEVNATPDLVNVFVRGEGDTAVAYVYTEDGGLGPAAAPEPASGPTFTADMVAFDPATVLDRAVDELPGSIVRVFSVGGSTSAPTAGAEYRIVFESVQGGSLSVMVRGDGSILGVDAE